MARFLILAVCLVGAVLADDGYLAPDQGYAAPNNGYAAPSGYNAPTAPQEYGVPSYDAPEYGAPEEKDLFNLDKILELAPFFLAVFAAIIVAQLFGGLFGTLFNAKLGLLAPFGTAKIDLINAVLNPFNLSLCTVTPLAVAGSGRSFASGFSLNPELIQLLTGKLHDAITAYSD